MSFFEYGEYGFSSMGIYGQNYVALLQESEMSRIWLLGIKCFAIPTLNFQWPNGTHGIISGCGTVV